jgi:GTP cyclohydrolase I
MAAAAQVDAPVSGFKSWQAYDLTLAARLDGNEVTVNSVVEADVMSLCPCSKAVSDYGAHNQRSRVRLNITGTVDQPYPIRVDEAFSMIRSVGSAPVLPLIKRPDERAITMQSYDKPAFVEDIVRDLSVKCRAQGVTHSIVVRNLESIHSHDAIARLNWVASS